MDPETEAQQTPRNVTAPMMRRAAETRPSSFREEDNSLEVVWTTGASVTRFDWWDGEYYDEVLSLEEGAVRLDRLNAGAAVLDTHDSWQLRSVIGSIEPGSARIDNQAGTARVRLSDTADVSDIVAKIREGHIRNISVGYIVHSYTRVEEDGKRAVMRADDWEPTEISFVPVPADAGAQVRSNATQGGFPCIIRGLAAHSTEETNMDPEEEGVAAAPAARTEPTTAIDPAANPAPARTAPIALSNARIRTVVMQADLGAEFALELQERNEQNPMSEADLTDAVTGRLQHRRQNAPVNSGYSVGPRGTESESYLRSVENAVLLRANPALQVTDEERAAAREMRGLSLMEMARDYLEWSGVSTRGMGRIELAGSALGFRSGSMTTSDFAHALSNAVSRRVREAYAAAPQTFAPIVSRNTLPDFKETNIIGLGDAPQLLLVKENAEFTYGAISDTGMSYALSTYGRIIAITRQAIINDDKNLFSRIPTMFGRKAADLESDLVWGLLTSNPTMGDGAPLFHSSHGNLAAAGGAISVATVGAGRQAMRTQKNADGNSAPARAAYLIVGPAKETEAQQFLTSVTATQTSNVNPFPGTLQLIVEDRITGNQWFLAAEPAATDTIELSHLEGQEGLYTETQPGFDVDGVKTKARLDTGAALLDFRGFYKNPGN